MFKVYMKEVGWVYNLTDYEVKVYHEEGYHPIHM